MKEKHSQIIYRTEWAVSHRPISPRGLIYFVFFWNIHLPLSLYLLHFVAFLSVLQCFTDWANWFKLSVFRNRFWQERSRWELACG